jgi:hypothetical protein
MKITSDLTNLTTAICILTIQMFTEWTLSTFYFENRTICHDFFAERRSRIVLLHVELVLVRRETPQKYVHIFGEDKKIHFGQSWKLYYFVVGNADANFALVVLLLCCVAADLQG